jgi:F0F1-type ATP synthase alpha subunit
MFAGTRGLLDDVAIDQVREFERAMLDYFRGPAKALREELVKAASFKGLEDRVTEALKAFKQSWRPSEPARAMQKQ